MRAGAWIVACLACAALIAGDTLVAGDVRDATGGASSRLRALGSGNLDAGFARALEPRPFVFPADHGPHPAFRHEWWYVTGNVDATGPSMPPGSAGTRFGFELTLFRFALAPPAAVAGGASTASASGGTRTVSAWRTRQVYLAHLAITDVARGRFHFGERLSRDALGLAGAQAEPFRVWLGDWSIGATPDGSWRLVAADGPYALDLALGAAKPPAANAPGANGPVANSSIANSPVANGPVANGDRGLSRKSSVPGAASYYYSIPRLPVSGTIVRNGQPLAVRGSAWLDREWGSGALGADQEGWDWFALQLDDGSALMFYALRLRGGARDPHSAGTFVAADGTARPLADADVQIHATATWDSPRGGRYPARWRVSVPSLRLELDVRPVLAD